MAFPKKYLLDRCPTIRSIEPTYLPIWCWGVFCRIKAKVARSLVSRLKLLWELLLSINGDLHLTVSRRRFPQFHYCQRYFSKRTWCLGRCLELQCCGSYALCSQTRSNELRGITGRTGSQNLVCVFWISAGFFLLFDHQQAFHCTV